MATVKRVEKFQKGKTIKFGINDKDYDIDEEALDSQFQDQLNGLIQSGQISKDEVQAYQQGYTQMKGLAQKGKYSIDKRGDSFGGMKYEGDASNEMLGLTSGDETAKPSWARRNLLGKGVNTKDNAQVMARINSIVGNALSGVSSKMDADALKLENEAKEKEKQRIKDLSDKKFDFYSVNYGGRENVNPTNAGQYYWESLNDASRAGERNAYYGNVAQTLFSTDYDNPEVRENLKRKGIDVEAARNAFTALGYDPATKTFTKPQNWAQGNDIDRILGTSVSNDIWYNKPKPAAGTDAAATTTGTAAGTTAETTPGTTTTQNVDNLVRDKQGKPFTGVHNGKIYQSGKQRSSLSYYDDQSGEYKFFAQGRQMNENEFYNYMQSLPEGNDILPGIDAMRSTNMKRYSGFASRGDEGLRDSALNSQFVFKDLNLPSDAKIKNITEFSDKYNNGQELQIFEYATKGALGFYSSKYRIATKDGKVFDGTVRTNGAGETIFTTKEGKEINLGRMSASTSAKRTGEFAPFSSSVTSNTRNSSLYSSTKNRPITTQRKNGGVIKMYSLGAKLDQSGQRTTAKAHQATMSEVFNPNVEMSTADKLMLGALATDTAGLVMSLTGVGSTAAGITGMAGTAATFASDVARDGFQWSDVGNAAMGLGMDVATMVPGAGFAAKAGKLAKAVRASHAALSGLMMGYGLTAAANVVGKIKRGEDVSISDWRTLAGGLQGLVTGKRMLQHRVATKTATEGPSIEVSVGGKKQRVALNDTEVAAINKGKDNSEITNLAKAKIAEKLKIENPDDIKLPTSLGFKKSWMPVGRKENFEVENIKGEKVLKDINDYQGGGIGNWFMRSAIKSTAAANPKMIGAEAVVGPDYKTMGFWGHKPRLAKMAEQNAKDAANAKKAGEFIDAMIPKNVSKGSALRLYRSPAGPEEKPILALPAASGKKYNDDEFLGNLMGQRREEFATARENFDKRMQVENEKDIQAGEVADRIAVRKKASDRLEAYKKNKESAEKNWRDIQARSQETRRRNKAEKLEKQEEAARLQKESEAQTKDLVKRISTQNKNNSKAWKSSPVLAKAPTKRNTTRSVNQSNLVTKSNGQRIILTEGQSNTLKKIKPENRQAFIDKNFKKGGVLKFASGGKGLGVNPDGTVPRSIFGKAYDFIGSNVNPLDLSEFARAYQTSRINKNVDINVKAPVLQQIEETPYSIKGNIMAKYAADKMASEQINQAKLGATADAKLNKISMGSAYNQANKLKAQGEAQNSEYIAKQMDYLTDRQTAYAQARNQIANQNIQSAAAADEKMRELKNVKNQMIYQPFDEFWKNLNTKKAYDEAKNKTALTGLKYNQAMEMIKPEYDKIMNEYNALFTKSNTSSTPLTEEENKRLSELERQLNFYQDRSQNLMYQLQLNPKFFANSNYWRMPSQVSMNKSGGKITLAEKLKLREQKDFSDYAKKLVSSSDKDYERTVKNLSSDIKRIDDLNKLIFKTK